jgi:aquaporin Z
VGLWIAKEIDAKTGVLYIGTQLMAAAVAALLVMWLFPSAAGDATSYGTPKISSDLTLVQGVVVEAILTLFLVSAVFGTAVSPDAPRVGGFGIGLVLLFGMLAAGPLTGGAMNPARAFGPALVAADFEGHMAYWIGPVAGGLAAGFLWAKLLLPGKTIER